jgi:FecR protein
MNVTLLNSLRARVGVAVAALLLLIAGAAWADPPARVVRLAYANGAVSFLPAGDNDWVQARINRPLWTGDQLWTAGGARAELQMGNAALQIAPETSLSIVNFDDRTEQFQVNQGTVNLYVRSLEGVIEIDTPNLAFSIRSPGQYRVDVSADATTVGVYRGEAEAFGTQAAYVIKAGERFAFRGTDLNDYQPVALAQRDAFDGWAAERISVEERSVSARYVSPDVIGYADLDANGTWTNVPTYGSVWVPSGVAADWAPYRYGHWAWVDPWGWTWVDDAAWGFAPFHYGRWAFVQSRWCWVPGPRAVQAVYAPALVAFVGGSNFGVSVSVGGGGAVGWFPLGPGDVYRPSYNVSREYFTRVNVNNTVVNVTNVTNVYNNPTQTNIRYVNVNTTNAVTAVPTQAFIAAQPVQRAAVKVDARTIQQAPVIATAPVAPVRTSIVGAAAPAQARPTAAVMERAVIAKQAPPPAAPSMQQREEALKRQPGKPLDQAELQKIAPQNAAARPNVRVVQPSAAPKPLPATAASAPEKGAPQAGAPPPTAGEQRGQPPVAGAPPKAEERRGGQPPTAMGNEKQGPPGARPEAKGPPSAAPGAPAQTQEARPRNVPAPGAAPPETTVRRPGETPQAATARPETPSRPTAQGPGAREPLARPGAAPKETDRGKEAERGGPPTANAPAMTPPQAAKAPTPPTPQGQAPQRPETANVQRPTPREAAEAPRGPAGQPPRPETANVPRPPTAQAPPPQRTETANAPRAVEPPRGPAAAPPQRPETANVQRPPATQAPPQRPETASAPRPVEPQRGPAAAPPPRPEAAQQRPAPVAQAPSVAAPPRPQEARPPQAAAPAGPPPQQGRPAEKGQPQKGPPEKDKQKEENK